MSVRAITQLRRQQVLAQRAAEMRAAPTRSEAAPWQELRARKLGVEVDADLVMQALPDALARVRDALRG